MNPVVVALHVTPASRATLEPRDRVRVLEDRGVEGDHHARPGSRRQVLLMNAETLDSLGLRPGDVREQLTVRGLDVMALAEGTRLRVGEAELVVVQPCDPCERMDQVRPGLRGELKQRRGRFVRVVRGGTLAIGDRLEILPGA